MTDATAHAPDTSARKGHTFGLFRVLAPALALLGLWTAVTATDPTRALGGAGQGVAMLAVALYAFRLKGRPVTARPPVHFPPEARLFLAMFCAGSMLWGIGLMGMAGGAIPAACAQALGLLVAVTPLATTLFATFWLRTDGGRAWRANLVHSA